MFRYPPSGYRIESLLIWRKYLEMTERPDFQKITVPDGLEIRRVEQPTLHFYHYLYAATGSDLDWVDRLLMPAGELLPQIHDPLVGIFVFLEKGCPAGYVELDWRTEGEVELKYFGLMPEFRNRRWGKKLLAWAIQKAWQPPAVRRMHFSTCQLDDPRALPIYLGFGFRVFEEKKEWQRGFRNAES